MGPLIPDILSSEFSLIAAFFIGIAFGFVLEQAGFSATRKLAGLFYGYDFTVLKVFFTAGITAMIGLLVLAHLGLMDLSIIYINPTYLWSALIGGAIMGAGFIIGGFCPGTSICAAAIGKFDAMIFVAGSLLGVFIFAESYPLLEKIFLMENWGAVRMDVFFNLSPEFFAFLFALMAAGSFIFVTYIENKINKLKTDYSKSTIIKHLLIGAIPFILIFFISITPDKQERIQNKINNVAHQKESVVKEMTADKVAFELIHNYYKINLIDVRPESQYKKNHLPLAVNIPLDKIFNSEWKEYFTQNYKTNIFYAGVNTNAKKAYLSAQFIGDSKNYILKETIAQFNEMFFDINPPLPNVSKAEANIYRFRIKAAEDLLKLDKVYKKFSMPVKKKARKIQGGCG